MSAQVDKDNDDISAKLCWCGKPAVSVTCIEIEPYEIYRCLDHTMRMGGGATKRSENE